MAKLWEVLKAFDEGTAVKATRYTINRLVELNKNQGNNGVSIYFEGSTAAFSVGDFEETDWKIVEKLDSKEFKFLFVVFQYTPKHTGIRQGYQSFTETCLLDAMRRISSNFTDKVIEVYSATGVTHEGETIILVQEGEAVK